MFAPQTSDAPRTFPRPADYYSTPAAPAAFPAWLRYGCGVAALAVLALLFAGGAFLAAGGMTDFMDLVLGMSIGEMKGMYTAEVTPASRTSLEAAVAAMREGLRGGTVSVAALQPFLETLRHATSDGKVDAREAERLRAAAEAVRPTARR